MTDRDRNPHDPLPRPDDQPRRRLGAWRIAVVAGLALSAAAWWSTQAARRPGNGDLGAGPQSIDQGLTANGRNGLVDDPPAEPAPPQRVAVFAPSSANGTRVAHVEAVVGTEVTEGDLLVILDNRDALLAELATAVSTAGQRQAELASAEARKLARIDAARHEQARVEAQLLGPRQQLARMRRLRERRIVTAGDLDRAVAAHDRAQRAVRDATGAVRAVTDATDPEVDFARLELDAANAALLGAELRAADALVTSPRTGRIAAVAAAEGDQVDGQPLLELEPLP